jgi:very-short-patch-repair endonuclease
VHYPDLLIKNHKPVIAVEIDGPVHWENTKALKKTNERNLHYEAGGIKMLWLTKNDVLVKDQSDLILNVAGKLGMSVRVTNDSD